MSSHIWHSSGKAGARPIPSTRGLFSALAIVGTALTDGHVMGDFNVIRLDRPEVRRRFITRLLRDVRAMEKMAERDMFETDPRRIGAEQEMVLVDHTFQPARINLEVLEEVGDPHLTTELGRFNLELNLDPVPFRGDALGRLERQIHDLLEKVRRCSRSKGADVLLVGVLPTLRRSDLTLSDMTPLERYRALNECLTRLHNGRYQVHVRGTDELVVQHDSMMMEACTTSFQVHVQVPPEEFSRYYNAAQAITGPLLAAATNAPIALGKRLWEETRIALFQQAVDTRKGTLYQRQMSPRVTFGSDWVRESVFEIFHEDVSRFRALLGSSEEEDPFEVLDRGDVPGLDALRMFNSTVYRWNRPCYGVTDGRPHLRIENRVMPAGPTVVDEIANAAFWSGLVEGIVASDVDVTGRLSFEDAHTNFMRAAQLGLEARFTWLDGTTPTADELIRSELLPIARKGLAAVDIDRDDVDRYLGIVEERVARRRTGAHWLVESAENLYEDSHRPDRLNALVSVLLSRQLTETPVHTWELASREDTTDNWTDFMRVEQCMTTDLFTVTEEEPIEFVASVMTWRNIRHLPVEDAEQRLTGLVRLRDVVNVLVGPGNQGNAESMPVGEIMITDPPTVAPDTSTLEAVRLMREHQISCLPVVSGDHRVIGILTERDFMNITAELMAQQIEPPA